VPQPTGSDKGRVCLTPATNKAHPEYGQGRPPMSASTAIPVDEWQARRAGARCGGLLQLRSGAETSSYASTGQTPACGARHYRCRQREDLTKACHTGKQGQQWSMSIFPGAGFDTVRRVWVYQMTPFDQWDYDGINENMLEDLNGRRQRLARCSSTFDRNRLRLCGSIERRHAAARPQVRHDELGRKKVDMKNRSFRSR